MNKGTLFVITGPSGTGKGTVLKEVLNDIDNVFMSVSATTRSPRNGEIHGTHYYFLSKEDFKNKIQNGEFLEYAGYVDNFYGTLNKPVEDCLMKGQDVILEIELQGALQVKEKRPDAVMIFIAPPSFEELKKRLIGRGTESTEKIEKRLSEAKKEMNNQDKFDYVVVNDVVSKAALEVEKIILSYRLN